MLEVVGILKLWDLCKGSQLATLCTLWMYLHCLLLELKLELMQHKNALLIKLTTRKSQLKSTDQNLFAVGTIHIQVMAAGYLGLMLILSKRCN